jgi:hypothetical protein
MGQSQSVNKRPRRVTFNFNKRPPGVNFHGKPLPKMRFNRSGRQLGFNGKPLPTFGPMDPKMQAMQNKVERNYMKKHGIKYTK